MKTHKIVGLMSGTSLDGLDLAYCHIWYAENLWNYSIEQAESVSYDPEMRIKLKNTINLSAVELLQLHNAYGLWLGEQAKRFISKNKLGVDAIASHGHTTHHRPELGLTFQIGSGQHLANISGIKVVCDFRTNDVALNGQGAPLVPIGDKLFFGAYDFCLNLGGISNVSFDRDGKRIAYDIGLANMLLNHITQKIGLDYDDGGDLAKSGKVNTGLMQKLDALDFYQLPYPKSIGYEWFVANVVPLIDTTVDTIENLLCTGVHHICNQVAIQILANAPKMGSSLLVTGGGALNTFMMTVLRQKLGEKVAVIEPPIQLIQFKEALVFALMGVLRLENTTNVLCSVTGARRDSSCGVIYVPT